LQPIGHRDCNVMEQLSRQLKANGGKYYFMRNIFLRPGSNTSIFRRFKDNPRNEPIKFFEKK